jgi:dolichyl-phosphate beta-glucosyltransferase
MKFSIVVPAYNEEQRVGRFLSDLMDYLKDRSGVEVIVVDDGSTDRTVSVVKEFKDIRIVSYPKNKGKGFAVKKGILAARGEKIIFMDADGATPPDEIPKMLKELDEYDVCIGTRTSKESNIIKWQPTHRVLFSKVFNSFVSLIFNLHLKDFLCGFKGFKKEVGKKLAKDLKSSGWDFDVELLVRARNRGYSIKEIPITWQDQSKSKLYPFKDAPVILINLLKLKFVRGL